MCHRDVLKPHPFHVFLSFAKRDASDLLIPTHSTKEAQPEEDPSVSARLQRLQNNYEDFGMRRTVEGVLVVHDHGHPHILMLQIANAFFKLYALPVVCALLHLT